MAAGTYAARTDVPVGRSRDELHKVLTRWGADQFAYGESADRWVVGFAYHGRAVRFVIDVPDTDQAKRQRWRALVLVVKAKLEAIALGLATFETEFLGHLVLPTGDTMGEHVAPQLPAMYAEGRVPQVMPALGP
jgi:hypothetical protein